MSRKFYLYVHIVERSHNIEPSDFVSTLQEDWREDTGGDADNGGLLQEEAFKRSVYELTDVYTKNVDADEYASFLNDMTTAVITSEWTSDGRVTSFCSDQHLLDQLKKAIPSLDHPALTFRRRKWEQAFPPDYRAWKQHPGSTGYVPTDKADLSFRLGDTRNWPRLSARSFSNKSLNTNLEGTASEQGAANVQLGCESTTDEGRMDSAFGDTRALTSSSTSLQSQAASRFALLRRKKRQKDARKASRTDLMGTIAVVEAATAAVATAREVADSATSAEAARTRWRAAGMAAIMAAGLAAARASEPTEKMAEKPTEALVAETAAVTKAIATSKAHAIRPTKTSGKTGLAGHNIIEAKDLMEDITERPSSGRRLRRLPPRSSQPVAPHVYSPRPASARTGCGAHGGSRDAVALTVAAQWPPSSSGYLVVGATPEIRLAQLQKMETCAPTPCRSSEISTRPSTARPARIPMHDQKYIPASTIRPGTAPPRSHAGSTAAREPPTALLTDVKARQAQQQNHAYAVRAQSARQRRQSDDGITYLRAQSARQRRQPPDDATALVASPPQSPPIAVRAQSARQRRDSSDGRAFLTTLQRDRQPDLQVQSAWQRRHSDGDEATLPSSMVSSRPQDLPASLRAQSARQRRQSSDDATEVVASLTTHRPPAAMRAQSARQRRHSSDGTAFLATLLQNRHSDLQVQTAIRMAAKAVV